MTEKIKVVFDTQIFLRALINRNSICYRLTAELDTEYILHVADGIIAEVLDVLTRSKIRNKFPQITDKDVEFIESKLRQAVQIDVKPEDIEPICRDPKDDIFLACAKLAQADYLVSEDKDLLVLEKYGNVSIIGVYAFLNILKNYRETQ